MPVYRFHFSLGRMLVLMAALGVWLAALGTLPAPWIVWLGTGVFYLAVMLCFSAQQQAPDSPQESPGEAGRCGAP